MGDEDKKQVIFPGRAAYELWAETNCAQCSKETPDAETFDDFQCALERAIAMAVYDVPVPRDLAKRLRCDRNGTPAPGCQERVPK